MSEDNKKLGSHYFSAFAEAKKHRLEGAKVIMVTKAFQIPSSFEVRFVEKAGGCERPHTHSHLVVTAVTTGHIRLQINGNELRMEKPTIIAIGPEVLHYVQQYSENFAGVYVFEVFGLPSEIENFNAAHFRMFRSECIQNTVSYEKFITLCEKLLSPLEKAQKAILYTEWLKKLFIDHYPSFAANNFEHSWLADRIRQLLDDSLSETPPSEEIAQKCGCTGAHCNRIFKRAYNISMQAYFLNKKAARARVLLATDRSLSATAMECGFYDQSHFNRIFKEIFQISPGKYREIISNIDHSHTR
ncbi:MAG: helix-turn-helix domain-containing protein [Deltaproteobacteria bacterium]|nr:helix-turn-helix domain-containing protein [Deltaproteobacteria bacterium]